MGDDFRFGARYNVLANPVVVTPLIAVRLPSHKYPTIGEAAVGPRLREVQVGVDAGRIFSVADQNFYIDAQYAYAFVQKFLGLSLNRSNVDVDLGYFVLPALNLRGIVSWQNTYDGLTVRDGFSHGFADVSDGLDLYHGNPFGFIEGTIAVRFTAHAGPTELGKAWLGVRERAVHGQIFSSGRRVQKSIGRNECQ